MIKKTLLVIAVSMFSSIIHAYTECTNLEVTRIFNDGHNTYVGFNTSNRDQLNGFFRNDVNQYDQLVSIALTARVSGEKVRIRYLDDNITCSPLPSWNKQITSVGF